MKSAITGQRAFAACFMGFGLLAACSNSPATDSMAFTGATAPAVMGASAGRPATTGNTTAPVTGSSTVGAAGTPAASAAGAPATAAAGVLAPAIAGAGGSQPAAAGIKLAAAGSAGGATGAAGAGGSKASAVKAPCLKKASQLVVVGDSYLNWITHSFPEDMTTEAGETWRLYAAGGCSLGSGGFCFGQQIPEQLDQAIADDPDIIAGVMTGGGNDILVADGVQFPGGEQCKEVKESPTMQVCQDIVSSALTAAEKLLEKAADASIRDMIYMFYPHIPGGGLAGENPNALLDYALPKAKALCDGAQAKTQGKLRCHFIDLVPVFAGHSEWFADDGIHENTEGSTAMAKEVIKVMKANCIAQPESSGCCEP